jgi:hypothetical protein
MKEADLQKAIINHYRTYGLDNVLLYHCANGEYRHAATGAKLKAMGVMPGVADLTIVQPGGKVAFLELKGGKGKLSDQQIQFRDWCKANDVPWRVTSDLDNALHILTYDDPFRCLARAL